MEGKLTLIIINFQFYPYLLYAGQTFTCQSTQYTLESYGKVLLGGSDDRREMHLVDLESITFPCDKRGLSIVPLTKMNSTVLVKWIFLYANDRDRLLRKVVCAKSGANSSLLLPAINRTTIQSTLFNLIGSLLG